MSVTTFAVVKTSEVSAEVLANSTTLPISRTDGKKGKSGACIVVPKVTDTVLSLIQADQYGKQWLIDQVDALRSFLASTAHKKELPVTSVTIGIDSILAHCKYQALSSTLSSEGIGNWFDEFISIALIEIIKQKQPAAFEVQIKKMVSVYRDMFCSLASRNCVLQESSKVQLVRALELIPEDSEGAAHPLTIAIAEKIAELPSLVDLL